nr:major histocompatibility complex class I-related gene protein-like [Nerophis lumbriciformis]
MNLLFFVLLAVQMQSVSPVIHGLEYFIYIESEDSNIIKYKEVCHLDGVKITQYDDTNRNVLPQQNWMKKITAEDPQYWQRATETSVAAEHFCTSMYEPHMKYYTRPEDTYLAQWDSGCQWNDDTDEVTGWYWDMFDGEDDFVEDQPLTWTAAKEQTDPPRLIWEDGIAPPVYLKDYVENCTSYLKKYLSVLLRTDLPMVSLNQTTQSSPFSCNATGFYPDKAVMFWRKDGEKLLEGVEQTEMLENQDGTFQMSVNLNATGDMEGKYECVFQMTGVKEDIVTKLESRGVLSNLSGEDLNTTTSGDTTTESQATIRPSTTSGSFDVTTESNKTTTRPSTTSGTLDVTTESNKATTRPSTTSGTLDVTTESNKATTRPSTTSGTLDVTTESNKTTTRPSTTSGTLDVTTESNKATTRPSTTSGTLDVTTESNKATTRPSTTSGTLDVTTESNKPTTQPTLELSKAKDLLEGKQTQLEDKVCVICVVATSVILTAVFCLLVIIITVMVKRYRKRHAPDPVVLISMSTLAE